MPVDIGTINFTIDNSRCWLWQYDQAPNLNALLQSSADFVRNNVSQFWADWEQNVFNIRTANTFGLNLWGKILGGERITYTNDDGETVSFTDDMYRLLLLARVMKFNSNGSLKSINDYLQFVFPDKPVFCVTNTDMSIRIILYNHPSTEDLAVIQSDGFIPVPAGVLVNYYVVPPEDVFGFEGSGLTGFDQGAFVLFN